MELAAPATLLANPLSLFANLVADGRPSQGRMALQPCLARFLLRWMRGRHGGHARLPVS
jgi:hypothetical protein